MLSTLKGALSTRLLASKSNHTISRASLIFAMALATVVTLLAGVFAFVQWRVADNLIVSQQRRNAEIVQRVGDAAGMATLQANAHRATLNALLSRDEKEFAEADNLRRKNLADYAALTEKLADLTEVEGSANVLRTMTTQYGALSDYVVSLLRQGRKEEALELRITRVRPLYNDWQRAQESFSIQLASEDQRQQDIHAGAVRATKAWLAGLLLAPLVAIALGVAAIIAILGLNRVTKPGGDNWSR